MLSKNSIEAPSLGASENLNHNERVLPPTDCTDLVDYKVTHPICTDGSPAGITVGLPSALCPLPSALGRDRWAIACLQAGEPAWLPLLQLRWRCVIAPRVIVGGRFVCGAGALLRALQPLGTLCHLPLLARGGQAADAVAEGLHQTIKGGGVAGYTRDLCTACAAPRRQQPVSVPATHVLRVSACGGCRALACSAAWGATFETMC
jgi:hypothetical protein